MRRYHLIAGLLGCFWWPGTTVTLSGAFCPAAAPAKAVPRQVSARYGRAATSRAGLWLTAVAPQSSQSRPEVAAGGLGEILESRGSAKQRYIFFGGKGGVGKTSTSAASAIRCADSGLTTLIISTDPAHSLGDALDQPVGGGSPVRVEGIDNLWAMEVDAEAAIKDFQDALGAFDAKELASSLGLGQEMVENLGLEEFGELLRNPPPGIDELVALAGVVELAQGGGLPGSGAKGETRYYDRIIIDTAPTGHTLRLLSFPDFLDSFLEKVIKLRSRLGGLLTLLQGFTGGRREDIEYRAEVAMQKLQLYKERMVELRELFQNPDATEFCVVTIPTQLAIAESRRLISSLGDQGVAVRNIIVNQVLTEGGMNEQYLQRLARGQEACLQKLTSVATGLEVSRVPYFDMEVAGVYPLRYMGQVAYKGDNEEKWRGLMTDPAQKFIIFGGKGGVGKTSSSAALAIQMADDGHSTVVVSSDPAHSLGDALQMDLDGRGLTRVPGITGTGKLYALEVDTEGAISEFKEVIDAFLHKAQQKGEGGATGEILSQLNLQDFADVLDNAPPGTDELVALSKVLSLVQGKNEEGIKFDRVIIDTAPTGHTLRMLSYPEFLDNFFDKLIRVRERFKGATSLLNMFSGKGGASKVEEDNDFEEERDRLRDFQFKMMMLEDLFRDEETSEFVVVTIPTMLAVAETASLVDQLREQKVPVRHAVVNKIISADTAPAYMNRMAKGQAEGLRQLAALATSSDVALTQVAYFDTEVRNIYGLRVMAAALFDQQH